MTTPHKYEADIIAWAKGATIEQRCKDHYIDWHEVEHPQWYTGFEYRQKVAKPADIVAIRYVTYTCDLDVTTIAGFGKPNKVKFSFDSDTRELVSVEHLKS